MSVVPYDHHVTCRCGHDRDTILVQGMDLVTGTYPIPSDEPVVGQTTPVEGDQMM